MSEEQRAREAIKNRAREVIKEQIEEQRKGPFNGKVPTNTPTDKEIDAIIESKLNDQENK